MRKKYLVFATILVLVSACSNDDGPESEQLEHIQQPKPVPELESVNNPPGAFGLINPQADNDREVLMPTFSWETAPDPEGDDVTYDLYVGMETNPQTILATSIVDTTFMPTANLELFATYYWKVVAKDSKGAEYLSTIQKFETKPTLFISEDKFDGKIVQIEYSAPGIIEVIKEERSEENIFLYSAEGKLSKQINRHENIDYEYDTGGRLSAIKRFEPISGDETFTKINYIELDRLQYIEKGYVDSDYVSGITISYKEGETSPLGLMFIRAKDYGNGNYDILHQQRYFFTWDERENLIEILVEGNNQMGNGFVFASLTKLTYDTMQNPAYDIIKTSFGFNDFFIEYKNYFNLKSIFLRDGLGWVSKNNLLTVERKYKINNQPIIYNSSTEYDYEYNSSGYPKTTVRKDIFEDGPPKFYERSWLYIQQ